MPSVLFFDSETTGIANFNLPPSHESHPHVVQWGAILDDENRRTVSEINLMIRPDGWTIPVEASNIHGITTESAARFGIHSLGATRLLISLIAKADLIVAHNMAFDSLMAAVCMARHGLTAEFDSWQAKPKYCTMQSATPILKLPGRRGDFKWPNLQEAHVFFCGQRFEGAHDAMEDVRACRRVYYRLLEFQKPAAEQAEMTIA